MPLGDQVHEIFINIVSQFDPTGANKAETALKDLGDSGKLSAQSLKDLNREMRGIGSKDLVLKVNDQAVRLAIEGLQEIEKEIGDLEKRRVGVPPGVRESLEIQRNAYRELLANIEGTYEEIAILRRDDLADQKKMGELKVKIEANTARLVENEANNSAKRYLKIDQKLYDEIAARRKQRGQAMGALAPDFSRLMNEAARMSAKLGGTLTTAAERAANWGARLDGVAGVLTRITPIMRGLGLVIGVSLSSAVTSLVSSLAAAAAGVVVLASSFAASLLPVIGVLMGFFSRLNVVMQVVQQKGKLLETAQKAQAAAATEQAAKNELVRNALNRVRDATQSVTAAQRAYKEAVTSAREAIQQALTRQAEAQRNLSESAEDMREAQVNAFKEIEQAAEDASDAVLAVEDAEIGLAEAKIGVKEAELALKQFGREAGLSTRELDTMFKKFQDIDFEDPGAMKKIMRAGSGAGLSQDKSLELAKRVLGVQKAKLDEKKATDQLADSEKDLTEKRERSNQLQQEGIQGVKDYRDAVDKHADAQRDLNEATREYNELVKRGVKSNPQVKTAADGVRNAKEQLTEARKDLTRTKDAPLAGAKSVSDAAAEYAIAFGKLSKAEQGFATAISGLQGGFLDLVRRGTDPLFTSLTKSLPYLERVAPIIGAAFTIIGNALGKGIEAFFKFIASPKVQIQLGLIAIAAGQLASTLASKAFLNFTRLFLNVAVAGLPLMLALVDKVATGLGKMADKTEGFGGSEVFSTIMESFEAVLGLVEALGGALATFFLESAGEGNKLLEFFRKGAEALQEWLGSDEGREAVKHFFEDTMPFAKNLFGFLKRLVTTGVKLFQIFAPGLADIFGGFNVILDLVDNIILDLLNKMPYTLKRLLGFILPVVGSIKGFAFLGTMIKFLGTSLGAFLGIMDAVGLAFSQLPDVLGDAFTGATDILKGWGQGILDFFEGFIKAVLEFFGIKSPSTVFIDIAKACVDGFVKGFKGLGKAVLEGAEGGLSKLTSLAGKVVDWLKKGFDTVTDKVGDIGHWLIRRIVSGAANIWEHISNLAGRIAGWLKKGVEGVVDKFLDIGRSIIDGLGRGLKEGGKAVLEQVKSFAGDIVDTVKAVLEIKSPSRVMQGLGEQTMKGFLKGLSNYKGAVVDFIIGELGADGMEKIGRAVGGGSLDFVFGAFWDSVGKPPRIPPKDFTKDILLRGWWTTVEAYAVNPGSAGAYLKQLAKHIGIGYLKDHLDDLVPHFAKGGVLTREQLFLGGEKGREAVLPLSKAVFAQMGQGIMSAMQVSGPGGLLPPSALTGSGGVTIKEQHVHLPPAPGHDQLGDPRVQAQFFAREMSRLGQGVL